MSTSRGSCCLPSVKKQKHDFQVFAFVQCIIKQLLDSVFVISRIIKVSVRGISLSLRLRLITLTSTLIFLDITKTESNNCLLSQRSQLIQRTRQSKLEVITCSRREARENVCERLTIGFGFTSDWMKKWREYFFSQS